ncbi:MAG: zinc ribbon domain-containing protein [Candidatus Kerfeldbacteria bacterium]|nr:zinc ribbon domain-containing protein [Candidatus Kerfeldbacteria bacterium]
MFGPKGPFCQSCGMPLNKDTGQREQSDYCSKCYQPGGFTEPNISLEQMQVKVMEKMKEMHFPKFMAKWFTKDMPKLKRWQNHG